MIRVQLWCVLHRVLAGTVFPLREEEKCHTVLARDGV